MNFGYILAGGGHLDGDSVRIVVLLSDSMGDEPEFRQILRAVENKYQAGHERVRLWLEERDMI